MTDDARNDTDLKGSLYRLADELGRLVLREHQILQGEMKQLGTLVGDAVSTLDSNFRHLSAGANEQAEIINRIFDHGSVDEEQKRRFMEISEQINANTGATIRVLQFDDIVQQLAGHAGDRIARMRELFNEIDIMLDKIKTLDTDESSEILKHIHTMHEEIGHFRTRLEKENPVKQKSMAEGRVELF